MVEGPQVVLKSKRISAGLLNKYLQRIQILNIPASALSKYNFHIDPSSTNTSSDAVPTLTAADITATNQFQEFINKELIEIIIVGKEMFLIFHQCSHVIRLHFGMDGSERITTSTTPIHQMIPKGSRKILTGIFYFHHELIFYLFDTNISIKTLNYMKNIQQRQVLDIMSPLFNINEVVLLLQNSQREIYEVIMDQMIMPGVGNVIKCEGLFASGLNPSCIAAELHKDQLITLVIALRRVAWAWFYSYPGTGGIRASKSIQSKHIFECSTPRSMITEVNAPLVKKVYLQNNCKCCNNKVTLIRSGAQRRITYFCTKCQPFVRNQQHDQCPLQQHVIEAEELEVTTNEEKQMSIKCSFCSFINGPGATCCEICSETLSIIKSNILASTDITMHMKNSNDGQVQYDQYYLTQPQCKCESKPVLQRVRKSGPNMHRLFWSCFNKKRRNGKMKVSTTELEQQSRHFVPDFSDITAPISGKEMRRNSCGFFAWADTQFPKCAQCNSLSILRRVLKPGVNNGKYFFSCPGSGKTDARKCSFFQWTETNQSAIGKENSLDMQQMVGSKRPFDQISKNHKIESIGLLSCPDIIVPL